MPDRIASEELSESEVSEDFAHANSPVTFSAISWAGGLCGLLGMSDHEPSVVSGAEASAAPPGAAVLPPIFLSPTS
jgi:hypothetical protein